MKNGTTHIIGAGLASLEAATNLAEHGRQVIVYETAAQAGGRCRSYYDTTLEMMIDNGNHLLLSGNHNALNYLKRINSKPPSFGPSKPIFNFIDAATKKRWILDINSGRLPSWLLSKQRRVPNTQLRDYLSILRLLKSNAEQKITELLDPNSILYPRLWQPFLLSALNTHPSIASAKLAGEILKNTLLKGGKACIPLVAENLSATFIDPAIDYLTALKMPVNLNRRLKHITFNKDRATALEFASGDPVILNANDNVICAIPSANITSLLPGIEVPDQWCGILNAHFRIVAPLDFPKMIGVINANIEWIFSFPDRISITISDADRFMSEDRETLAKLLWSEIAVITGLPNALPPWQIVKEKRATFSATPEQNAKRPSVRTPWRNVFLAGDWTQTGLPSTIEGAIFSGKTAANMVMRIHGH